MWQNPSKPAAGRRASPSPVIPGLVRHSDPAVFFAAAAPLLVRDEAAAAAFASWVTALRAHPVPGERAYLATFAQPGARGAALQRRDGPVVIESSDPEAAVAFARDLAEEWPRLQGVVGAPAAVAAFVETWRECTGRGHALRFRMRHHRLTDVAVVDVPPGAARVAEPRDAVWLVGAQLSFLAEVHVPDDAERIRGLVPHRIARGEYWVWDRGGPVALAGWSTAAPDSARIAPVYTDPAQRRLGYASALVAALAQTLLDGGRRRLFLVTDLANSTSNAIYARIGFRPLSDIHHVDFTGAGPAPARPLR